MGLLDSSKPTPARSKRTSKKPRSSGGSSTVSSEALATIATLQAQIKALEEQGRPADVEKIAALEQELTTLKAQSKPNQPASAPASPSPAEPAKGRNLWCPW